MKFNSLKINQKILDAIKEAKYDEMTEIQENVIPLILKNNDVLAQAPTGTGKTATFVIPTIEKIDTSISTQVIVISPTRELAIQIDNEYKKIGSLLNGFKTVCLYGGQKIDFQLRWLKNDPQVIVGTPGRILDHINRNSINFNDIKTIILDEADEMLNMGFIRDIERIISKVTKPHNTILISATLSDEVKNISKKYQKDPIFFKTQVSEKNTPKIDQHFIKINEHNKLDAIKKLLQDNNFYLTIIFTNTKWLASKLANDLNKHNISSESLHGDLRQNKRDSVMKLFKNGKIQVLVATDVAARGIDVNGVDAVINYDVPKEMQSYVHRVGRTGRAQTEGKAFTFVSNDANKNIADIERTIKKKLIEFKIDGIDYDEKNLNSNERNNKNFSFSNNNGNTTRYFINIGSKDVSEKQQLKDFILKNAQLKDEEIIDIWLKDTFSFVEVPKELGNKLNAIQGMEFEGRKINIDLAKPREKNNNFGNNRNTQNRNFGNRSRNFSGGFDNMRNSGNNFGRNSFKSNNNRRNNFSNKTFGSNEKGDFSSKKNNFNNRNNNRNKFFK